MQEKAASQDAARDRVTTNIRYNLLLRIVPRPERVVEGREVVRDPRPLQFLRVVGGRVDRRTTTAEDARRQATRGGELLA